MWDLALGWMWPSVCAACGREGMGRICPACSGIGLVTMERPPEGVRAAFFAGTYDGPLGAVVRRAKYRPDRHAAAALGALLASHSGDLPIVDFVVPAPSTARRRIQRGFAPAAVLGAAVAKARSVPVRHALTLSEGAKQAASTGRRRRDNLAGRVCAQGPIHGSVLLVDDVVTTGATATACAQVLLCEGARAVWLLTACATLARNAEIRRVENL